MLHSEQYWIEAYSAKEALWIHDGNPRRPHALLTSGNHSNGFFNSRPVIADDELMYEASDDLLRAFLRDGGNVLEVDGVVGPQTGATKLAKMLMAGLVYRTERVVFFASPSKHEGDAGRFMIFSDEEHAQLPNKRVLLCEDVLTIGGSVELTAEATMAAGARVLPYLLVLVNRSGLAEVGGKKIVALINRPMPMWMPEECPLCKAGSEAIRPKDNWTRLNAAY